MNTQDLIGYLAMEAGYTHAEARRAVDKVFAAIVAIAATGEDISLAGFGTFKIKQRSAFAHRRLLTGKIVQVSAERILIFSPSKVVRSKLNG